MGEPITLVGKDGKSVTAYGAAQAAAMLEQGYSLPADQYEDDTEQDAAVESPPAPKQATRKRAGKSKEA